MNSSVRAKIQPFPKGVLPHLLNYGTLTEESGEPDIAQQESTRISITHIMAVNGNWRLWQSFQEMALIRKVNT